jgi:hypothetical protein
MTLRSVFILLCLVVMSLSVPVADAADSLLDRLLRIAGLTAAPSQMKGGDDAGDAGDVWVADLERKTINQVTRDGGYRSPVFVPGDDSILALKGDRLVRIAPYSGTVTAVQNLKNAVKLVGFDIQDPDLLLVLLEIATDGSPLGLLSLQSGNMTALSYDRESGAHRSMLFHIRGQERVYGSTSVYVKSESKRGMARMLEWTDVYLKRGEAPPQNISACDGVNCGQPSLSQDGRRVVFIKVGSVH